LVIVALVTIYGTPALAAYGVTNRLLMFAVIPCFGMGNAGGTLVGQNLGARKPQRAEKTAWWVTGYAMVYSIVVVIIIFTFAPTLIKVFVSNPSAEVLSIGIEYVRIVAPSLVIMTLGIVLERGFSGAGDTVPPMMINLFTLWGIEVAFAYALSRWFGLGVTGVWWGRSIAGVANGLVFVLWFKRGKWKERDV
jgi:Na+-driven multidrug efflux pump